MKQRRCRDVSMPFPQKTHEAARKEYRYQEKRLGDKNVRKRKYRAGEYDGPKNGKLFFEQLLNPSAVKYLLDYGRAYAAGS